MTKFNVFTLGMVFFGLLLIASVVQAACGFHPLQRFKEHRSARRDARVERRQSRAESGARVRLHIMLPARSAGACSPSEMLPPPAALQK